MIVVLLFVVGQLPGVGRPAGPMPADIRIVGLTAVTLMAMANAFAAHNFLRPSGRWYDLFSSAQPVADTLSTVGIVIAVQAHTGVTVWPLLALPVIVSALRRRLAGALTAWGVICVLLAGAIAHFGDALMAPDELTLAFVLGLLIAVLVGTQSSAYGRQFQELERVHDQ